MATDPATLRLENTPEAWRAEGIAQRMHWNRRRGPRELQPGDGLPPDRHIPLGPVPVGAAPERVYGVPARKRAR